jgi:hypothetical protein
MTDIECQARFRSRLRALASEPERLLSGNYRDACPYCGQVSITASAFDLDGARCACPPTRHTAVYLVELVCMSCARPVATLRARTPRARVLLPRQPRCQVCGGAAVVGDLTVSPNTEKRPGADGLKAAS